MHNNSTDRFIEQDLFVRTLKTEKADKAKIDEAEAKLLVWQDKLPELFVYGSGDLSIKGNEAPYRDSGNKSKESPFTLKTHKVTREYNDEKSIYVNNIVTIKKVFKKHGGVLVDSPVFELQDILDEKNGKDRKLVYDLEYQSGEKCLNYDLTGLFSRNLAMNESSTQQMKRYRIAKVFRRDQPATTKGRVRELYQCDFEIAGSCVKMIPDAKAIVILIEALNALDVGDFKIKINHRKILDGMFAVCGVPEDKFRSISSAVYKSEKLSWEEVRKEMIEEKGLEPSIADKIGEFINLKGIKCI